ncbi:phosphonopyruvate decarboxylase [Amycolatopsis xylanica]|uniref:Phosphonopyruvate decarboxylase n=1 Tax=Amycolatopsis xylanica TaxID=589385 RepID=A0A1H2U199_9PSEU|nr:thiamine pyrophosphate-dependent enzyme [Amycolatopsis xylanica]SDW49777.1 phosphonopyruvate decarboxylase [Amycolatopsis xylanica]
MTAKPAAIQAVITAAARVPIVFTTGYTSRIACGLADRPNHFYMTGSMGLCASVASGLSLATGQPVVAADGDGSLLMNPSTLVMAGSLAPLPLVHVLLDDDAYDSTGGQLSGSGDVDLCAWALACGYRTARTVPTAAALGDAVAAHIADGQGPVFLRCPLRTEATSVPGRVTDDLAGHARRFAAQVATLQPKDPRCIS